MAFYNLFRFLKENPFVADQSQQKISWRSHISWIQDSWKRVMNSLQTYSSDKSPIRFNPLPWYLSYGTQGESNKIRVRAFQPAHFAQGSSLPLSDIFHVLWCEQYRGNHEIFCIAVTNNFFFVKMNLALNVQSETPQP